MRSSVCKACGIVLLMALFPAPFARGDAEPPAAEKLSPEKLKAEIERLQQEIAALKNSADAPPEWKEAQQILAKVGDMDREKRELWERFGTLWNAAPTREWEERISKLSWQLYRLQMDDRERARAEGERLYEARHRELEKRGPTETPNLHRLGFDVLSYPRIDGSTSTIPLSILIACRCFEVPSAWVGSNPFTGARYEDDSMFEYGPELPPPEPEFRLAEFATRAKPATPAQERLAAIINRLIVATPDTHEAYVRLIEGRSEFGLLARGPSPAELDLARQKGIELQTMPCALDALVFLVNEENDLKNLTSEQLRSIYSGKITRWKEVGSALRSATPSGTEDAAITPYQREEQSGSQELMRTLVMKELPFVTRKDGQGAPQLIVNGMGGPFVVLHGAKNGLAYSVYYYERYMAGSARTKVIAVDGVEPTDDSIRTRKYPFVSEVLIVTRKDLDPKAPAARLRDWLLSPEGQAVVYESGYVPLPANSSK